MKLIKNHLLEPVRMWLYILRVSHRNGVVAVNNAFDVAIRVMFCVILVALMVFGFTVAIPTTYMVKRVVRRIMLIGESNG